MSATRRLAAIAVADVVGYSRLMEADETGTLAALRQRKTAILEPVVRAHGGRIVKMMGDGALIEFASAVNAVKAALELQSKFSEANDDLPDDRRIVLRIGINLGDVIGEGSDIYGDGVNIAARLESLTEPGGICISNKVHDEIRGKIEASFEDMGEQQLKNIAVPVRAYRLAQSGSTPVSQAAPASDRPSIAVLPFTNMSGDPEQQYFSDGITEDIITELSRFRSLFVIARNSSFQYRDKAVDVRGVGRELGVRYVVEGSVRKMASRVRITAQLIDVASGNHLWSERFDRNLAELFEVQDEVTQTIVATVTGRLQNAEIKSAAGRKTSSVPAYDCYLRGVAAFRSYGENENQHACEWFERAIASDPDFAVAYASLSMAILAENDYGGASEAAKARALDLALTAVRLDSGDSRCHLSLAWSYRFHGKFDLAISHMEQGVKLNANDAYGLAQCAGLLGVVGRCEDGIDYITRAMRLDPLHTEWFWGVLALNLFLARRYQESLDANGRIGKGKKPWQLARDAACLAQLDRLDEARAVAGEVLRLKPGFRIGTEMPTYKRDEDACHLSEALRKAGLPE
ncbi:adenylate/guanylate cyclase domain-containing protein [soil metagenome]